jgi:hypothetical protein
VGGQLLDVVNQSSAFMAEEGHGGRCGPARPFQDGQVLSKVAGGQLQRGAQEAKLNLVCDGQDA